MACRACASLPVRRLLHVQRPARECWPANSRNSKRELDSDADKRMRTSMSAQRWTSWLLLIAFLHGVLAPAVGQAMGGNDAARTIMLQLCSADGPRLAEVDLHDVGTGSDTSYPTGHGGFCPLCVYPAAPPPAGIAALQPAGLPSIPVSVPDDSAPRFATAWSPVHPRAPPPGV